VILTDDEKRTRFYAADTASNGHFLTGVVTTGIYCLPSCTARKPRPENIRFFATEAEARDAGLRPCRRCKPDAFYRGETDADEAVVEALVARVRVDPAAFADVAALAETAGVGLSKLHALLRRHCHTTPLALLTTARVDAARQRLLANPHEKVSDIAFAVGFGTLSAFGENFRRLTRMTPQTYRRLTESASFALELPDDYPAGRLLEAIGRDPNSPTERVDGRTVTIALRLDHDAAALVRVTLGDDTAAVLLLEGPLRAQPQVQAQLLALLGLAIDPQPFETMVAADPALAHLVGDRAGLRPSLIPDPMDGLLWAVLAQQVTLSFAMTLRRRVLERWGQPMGDGLFAVPAPRTIAALHIDDLTPLSLSRAKAATLIGVAQALASGALPLNGTVTGLERALLDLRGIGPWSSQYFLMRVSGALDCVPLGDTGVTEALKRFFDLPARPDHAQTLALMERFRPWRSLATQHLWRWLRLTLASEDAP
jgi:AraC family transcriptional regulator of adaptative response / DNA-3-methyladenine glycosylase II